jgi:hypothetical protein
MNGKNILRFAVPVFAVCALATSCNGWLDVRPKAEEDATDLYSSPDGFKSALAGCYTVLTETTLYGRELTYGMVGMLGQEWGSGGNMATANSLYYNIVNYEYEEVNVEAALEAVWRRMYYAIAQCNTVIEYTRINREVLDDLQYAVIRGEAVALRAFVHAELFRLFGKVSDTPAQQSALPYVRGITTQISPQLTNEQFYECFNRDVDEALELLADDPMRSGDDMQGVENGYYVNRQFHMNYYAVLALRARMQLHMGDRSGALQTATTVIAAQDGSRFRWITQDEATNSVSALKDRTFSTEHLFALNTMELGEYIKGYFRETESLLTWRLDYNTVYDGVPDFRGTLFENYTGYPYVFAKFWQMTAPSGAVGPKKNRMPLIRLPELYYIAIEAQLESNPAAALDLLNTVLDNRNMHDRHVPRSVLDTPGALEAEYLKDMQKELLGEGQLWFYHKRRGSATISTRQPNYILPIPTIEWEYGDVEPIE